MSVSPSKLIQTQSPGYARDPSTGAIINTNISEYETILSKRAMNKQYTEMKCDLDSVKEELSMIRSLLMQIVQGHSE